MKSVKTILLWLVALMAVGYVAGIAVWSAKRANTHICQTVEITITDFARRQYVTEAELVRLLKDKNLYPVGRTASAIAVQQIEDVVRKHPMVHEAQCYVMPSGTVRLRLSQRIPVLRIVTGDESYFVDSERTKMPVRESVTTPVMVASGNIGEHMACGELADMALWIADNKYWSEKIQRIRVTNPKMVYLVQRPDGTHIILGEINGYRNKLRKLRTLYEKGFDEIGWRTYSEIDLRFTGQVIGRN